MIETCRPLPRGATETIRLGDRSSCCTLSWPPRGRGCITEPLQLSPTSSKYQFACQPFHALPLEPPNFVDSMLSTIINSFTSISCIHHSCIFLVLEKYTGHATFARALDLTLVAPERTTSLQEAERASRTTSYVLCISQSQFES